VHVIFIAPHFPASQPRFVQGLKKVGARVTGIGDMPLERLPEGIKRLLDGYEYVPNLGNVDQVTAAVREIQKRGPWVHHLEATIEAHMYMAARVRERTGIPGLSLEQVTRCRDKTVMKDFLRTHGIPCAANAAISTVAEARAFAARHGYPLIMKPRDGAGAAGTTKITDDATLERACVENQLDGSHSVAMEVFIEGHEGFYDTMTVRGETGLEFITHYYPNVLDSMRNLWISPYIVTTNRVDAPGYNVLRKFGREVIGALGLNTTATHMEWFYGPRGLMFSEIGARPPGCNMWDLYAAANDFDIYEEWARAICWGEIAARPSRRYAAGLISLRPNKQGTIKGYTGLEEVQRKYGPFILDAHLPSPGQRTAPVEAGYLAHAWMRVRHPDYDGCRAMLDDIGSTFQMWAE
jgi:formate-dependent phosphoribosylglycinamide formyltransferase (GAR transformylase)